eukprot:comp24390_c0_seq1/m.46660 comp24390_c0_seq1/g.46660  ORF comp24390_c0_seq1/g.46660 comp24390_c0_seq1/m.46660 type:complete len:148 (-) comp24390_c0_seq1:88-531(-)
MPGVTVKDVKPAAFVQAYAEFLKQSGKIETPKWVDYAKTGTHKELGPYDQDWFYIRAAAIARHVYVRSPVGVGGLKKVFGGPKNRGTAPSRGCVGSGSVARACLQQLEKLGIVEKHANGGRIISSEGRRDLDRIAGQVAAATKEASE